MGKKTVFFGFAHKLPNDNCGGMQTDVSMASLKSGKDAGKLILEVHKSEWQNTLWYSVGVAKEMTVDWKRTNTRYDDGVDPTCAVNGGGQVFEVHVTNAPGHKLWYRTGSIALNDYTMKLICVDYHDYGVDPDVALNNAGVAVEVHKSPQKNELWLTLFNLAANGALTKKFKCQYQGGQHPNVTINNHNILLGVHYDPSARALVYVVGKVNQQGDGITWLTPGAKEGGEPKGVVIESAHGNCVSIALNDDNDVVAVYQDGQSLYCRTGKLNVAGNAAKIEWFEKERHFDDGYAPSLAIAGDLAIVTHAGETSNRLWYSTSLIMDRANWMRDTLNLNTRTLKNTVIPGTHNSGMIGGSDVPYCQDLSVYDQLLHGIRFFDFRPGTAPYLNNELYVFHGNNPGKKISIILDDVAKFVNELDDNRCRQELIILKFSHYKEGPFFDEKTYDTLIELIKGNEDKKGKIGSYLITKKELMKNTRIAKHPFSSLINNQSRVLVVCDGAFPITTPHDGIWQYANHDDEDVRTSDLRVFDSYTKNGDHRAVIDDQLTKFNAFSYADITPNTKESSDLFLLSWTTTYGHPWVQAKGMLRELADEMAKLTIPSAKGAIPNILYLDYAEYGRVAEVVACINKRLGK